MHFLSGSLSINILEFICVVTGIYTFFFFFFANWYLLYEYITIRLSIHLLMDIWLLDSLPLF